MTIKPPVFDVADTCTILSGPEFESSVLGAKRKGAWLVMLTAPWSETCSHALPLFSELSLRYVELYFEVTCFGSCMRE
jgi:hypothetical protein